MAILDRIRLIGLPSGTARNKGLIIRYATSRRRSQRRAVTVVLTVVVTVVVAAGAAFAFGLPLPLLPIDGASATRKIVDVWNAGELDTVRTMADDVLEERPLDPEALVFRGFSRFYLSLEQVSAEDQHVLLVGATQDLRRALLADQTPLEPEVRYVLGKTYFRRGEFFYDTAYHELNSALTAGFSAPDLREYLGLTARELGRLDESAQHFRLALEEADNDLYRLALAEIEIERDRPEAAEAMLTDVADSAEDTLVVQQALQLLGSMLLDHGRNSDAEAVFTRLLQVNANSADAHFGLGEVFLARNERDKARYEWREAVRLDPNHIESLRRLQEY